MDSNTTAIMDVKEALNEYFKLKFKYETQNNANKKKILNNANLSNREKRAEFLKLKPKCINCKRPGEQYLKPYSLRKPTRRSHIANITPRAASSLIHVV